MTPEELSNNIATVICRTMDYWTLCTAEASGRIPEAGFARVQILKREAEGDLAVAIKAIVVSKALD